MKRNFDNALKRVLEHEGGFVNHPRDPGGATNKGITIATFRRFVNRKGTVADLKRLTTAQAGKVYRAQYWNKVKGDELPDGVDHAVFDYAVNSGPSRSAKYLQRVVGVTQDGQIGSATIAACRRMSSHKIIARLCADRMAFLKRLKTWDAFGKGWGRRVNRVESAAIAMANQHTIAPETHEPAPKPPKPTAKPSKQPVGERNDSKPKMIAIIAVFVAVVVYLKWFA